jgi:hypothetical protein
LLSNEAALWGAIHLPQYKIALGFWRKQNMLVKLGFPFVPSAGTLLMISGIFFSRVRV